MKLLFAALAALSLSACGAPRGFTGEPRTSDHETVMSVCMHRSWVYMPPQAEAVLIDCLTDAGYSPTPETVKRREEIRQQGF